MTATGAGSWAVTPGWGSSRWRPGCVGRSSPTCSRWRCRRCPRVRRVLDQYLKECQDNGTRPSVLALAAKFDLSNTTFRRHFPDLAKEVAAARFNPEQRDTHDKPSPYEILVARTRSSAGPTGR